MTKNDIINQVAEIYGITADELIHGRRQRRICDARHVAMYLCHRILGMSKRAIGAIFGKDHGTALYAIKKVSDYVAEPRYNREAAECVQTIMWNNKKT